jgi:putative phosphoesterase
VELTVAALYDVHGNLPALEAVLAEVEHERPDVVLFGGDLVWGPWPRETLELALSLGERTLFVRGNWERGLFETEEASAVWTREQLTAEQCDLVRSWPETVSLDGVLYCHATPRSDEEIVLPGFDGSPWEDAFAGVDEPLVVCGHTHLQFDVRRAGRRIVNPGSIGNPTVRATAWWALVGQVVELRTTDYDTAAAAAAMRATGFPRPDLADELLEPYTLERLLALVESFA